MDTSRIINIVLSDLALDTLKEQEQLERAINFEVEIGTKVSNIKDALRRIAINELMITKFQSLITKPTPENG
jgi:hypothetical protein